MNKMPKSIISKIQVKDIAAINGKPLSVAEEYYSALDEKVRKIVEESCKRAKSNSRNTVMARDL